MHFFDLMKISERFMELVNPTTPEKVLKVGKVLGLKPGDRVIDFGCGYGEVLVLWAEEFGISGVGIDIRDYACQRAEKKMIDRGLRDRIEIVNANAREYQFEEHAFDVAACIGATFIWDDSRSAIQAMKKAIKPGGKMAVGEAFWQQDFIPPDILRQEPNMLTEFELLQVFREEGFEVETVVRASHDDWDNYVSGDWVGLVHWIEENPDDPEREEVVRHFHQMQDKYFKCDRLYIGWAMYVLRSVTNK